MNKQRELNTIFSIALDAVSEPTLLCDIKGNVIFLNEACKTLLGAEDRESVLGTIFYERLASPHKEEFIRSFVDRNTITKWRGDTFIITMQRKTLPMVLQSTKHIAANGERYLSNVFTDRIDAKEVLYHFDDS